MNSTTKCLNEATMDCSICGAHDSTDQRLEFRTSSGPPEYSIHRGLLIPLLYVNCHECGSLYVTDFESTVNVEVYKMISDYSLKI